MYINLSNSHKNFIYKIISIIIIILGLYIFFSTVFKWFLPFILAYIIANLAEPIVSFLEKKLRMPRKISSLITILFILIIIGFFIFTIVSRMVYEIKRLSEIAPDIITGISDFYNEILANGVNVNNSFSIEFNNLLNSLLNTLLNNLNSLLVTLTEYATKIAYNFAASLPSVLIFIVVLFISTYFLSSDKKKISRFLSERIPSSFISNFSIVKNDLLYALFGFIKAQLILMCITFIEISIGMFILGIDYPILAALLISCIDALPILGTGLVLIPWALFELMSGNVTIAIYLAILYSIVLLVRQILEPKVVGKVIGLYPLITLMSVYAGVKIFGPIGIALGPITVLILKSLSNTNIFKIWK